MDLSELGKEPIHPDQPAGCDVRYDPIFDKLQAEVDRASLPSVAGAVDWEKVVSLGAEILSRKSKDLLVAGYLAVGLIHTRQLDGLSMALKIYADLVACHGETLYPERQRGRLRAVEWWLEKCEIALNPLEATTILPAHLAMMEEHLEKLDQGLRELLPGAPSLQVLQKFLHRAVASRPDDPGPKPPEAAVVEPQASSCEGGAEGVLRSPPQAPTDSDGAIEDGLHRLLEAAIMLRDQDIRNPRAYRLCRHAIWLDVEALPPAHTSRTLLPPPPGALRHRFADLLRGGDSMAIIKEAETQLNQFIFWLDLNRITAEALADLGAMEAVAAVSQETDFLLQRLPGLDDLTFSDGTPFADADTKQWLHKYRHPRSGRVAGPPANSSQSATGGDSAMGVDVQAASSLIEKGKLIEAFELFQERLKSPDSERERLQWRLAFCRLLTDADHFRFATPHLEEVITDIDRHGLDSYEPAMALKGLELAWRCFDSQAAPCFQEKAGHLLNRIARINPAQMIRLINGDELIEADKPT